MLGMNRRITILSQEGQTNPGLAPQFAQATSRPTADVRHRAVWMVCLTRVSGLICEPSSQPLERGRNSIHTLLWRFCVSRCIRRSSICAGGARETRNAGRWMPNRLDSVSHRFFLFALAPVATSRRVLEFVGGKSMQTIAHFHPTFRILSITSFNRPMLAYHASVLQRSASLRQQNRFDDAIPLLGNMPVIPEGMVLIKLRSDVVFRFSCILVTTTDSIFSLLPVRN